MGSEVTTIPQLRRVYYDTYANLPTVGVKTGDLGYATDLLVLYRWSGAAWQAITMSPIGQGARVYHNAAQAIATSSGTALAFNNERYDTDLIHDPATNNSRLTCQTAGKYLIIANIQWAANATGFRQLGIMLNGTTTIAQQRVLSLNATGFTMSVSTI